MMIATNDLNLQMVQENVYHKNLCVRLNERLWKLFLTIKKLLSFQLMKGQLAVTTPTVIDCHEHTLSFRPVPIVEHKTTAWNQQRLQGNILLQLLTVQNGLVAMLESLWHKTSLMDTYL